MSGINQRFCIEAAKTIDLEISIVEDTTLDYKCTLINTGYFVCIMATRQNSSNGKPKSPRVQVVLPEELCDRLTVLAERESRTVSNMAKVLIQEGVNRFESEHISQKNQVENLSTTDQFRSSLEKQQARRLRGAPRRIKFYRP